MLDSDPTSKPLRRRSELERQKSDEGAVDDATLRGALTFQAVQTGPLLIR